MAVQMMHHAPAHHHCDRLHPLLQAGYAQAVPTALGQRQIDRPAAEKPGLARVGPPFEDFDGEAALREQGSQQCADEAGADQGDLVAMHR